MGQQVFVPHSGGAGGVQFSTFVTAMLDGDGGYVEYGFEQPGGGGDVFWNDAGFTALVAFRVIQDTPDADGPIPILTVVNGDGESAESYFFQIDGITGIVSGEVGNGGLTPTSVDVPLGRVIVAAITYEPGIALLYLNGLPVANAAPTLAVVDPPVSILLGTGTNPDDTDYVQYLGFGFIQGRIGGEDIANIYMASQDAGKLVIPVNAADGNGYVVYNAATGLSNLALWTPEVNTMLAPDLPAIPNGVATGTLLAAPLHVAHSGFAVSSIIV